MDVDSSSDDDSSSGDDMETVIERLMEELQADDALERARDVVFMPCFHAVSCSNCGLREDVDTCPICRVPVKHKRRIYGS